MKHISEMTQIPSTLTIWMWCQLTFVAALSLMRLFNLIYAPPEVPELFFYVICLIFLFKI